MKPWFQFQSIPPSKKEAIVIGAGLAGSAVASGLVRRGWKVIVLDEASEIAQGASGNRRGVIYPHIAVSSNPTTLFSNQCYEYLLKKFETLHQVEFDLCGLLVLAPNAFQEARLQKALSQKEAFPFARLVTAAEASEIAGVRLQWGGIYMNRSGWVQPRSLCISNFSGVSEIRLNTRVESMQRRSDGEWELCDNFGTTIAHAPIVVFANGFDCKRFSNMNWLPLFKVRGQVQHFSSKTLAQQLRCVVTYGGYVTPADQNGEMLAGATFDWKLQEPEMRVEDASSIFAELKTCIEAFEPPGNMKSGRVGFRATSIDTLPMIGPVPDKAFFDEAYKMLIHGWPPHKFPQAQWEKGLYVSVGHGSRGILYTQWGGELLAAQISGEGEVFQNDPLYEHIQPARFLIRGYKSPST